MVARRGLEGPNTGYKSSLNSSTSNINTGSDFTGTWEPVDVGSRLVLTLATDQNVDLEIQYSPDGSNQDSTIARYYRTSQIEAPHIFINARGYVRVKVDNDSGTNTTYFRLDVSIVKETGILNIPNDSAMAQDYDAISVRPTEFRQEVALGRRQGWETWNKFGYNLDVDSGGAEIIASWGGTFSRMTSADTLDFVSSSANDDDGGTGVNSIIIYGIDENRDSQTEILTLDGTTTVTTTNQWLGVNRIAIYTCGSGETNAGTITGTATTAGSTQAQMPVATSPYFGGVSQQLIFHVPRNHVFLASYLRFGVNKLSGSSPKVTLRALVYSAQNGAIQQVWAETIDTSVENTLDFMPIEPFPITEQTILYFQAITDTNNTIVSGRFGGELVRDVDA